jgi:hypothetical protein
LRWTIARALAVVFVVLLLAAGGALWYAQPLSEAHALSRAGRFYTPLDDVWAVVLDIEKYPEWRSDLAGVERQPDMRGHEVWREIPKSGPPVTWETVEVLKDRRLVRCVVDQGGDFGGCVTAEIIRRDDGAIVTIAEKFKVHSTLFRYTNTVTGRRARLDTWLTDLGKKFGGTVRVADLPKDLRDPPAPPVEGGNGPLVDEPAPPSGE